MGDIREAIAEVNENYKGSDGKPQSLKSYKLVYDSDSNQIEPIYYWILDFLQETMKIEKVTDNFMSSPGSGHFADMGQRATAMQQQATKILADTNVVIKSIIQLVYDLKEYEMRLEHYKRANSKDPKEKEEGMLAIKNIWLDQVDLKRGRGSIHQMAAEMGFTTLREAFLIANTVEDVNKMAEKNGVINDSVKRVLIPRLSEFLIWKEMSEKELTKRFEIEKSYLKSQVESLKMYTKWARPYLKAAKDLGMSGFDNKGLLGLGKSASLVNAFSTTMFELTIMGNKEIKIASNDLLKKRFGREYPLKRKYYSIVVVSLNYRGLLAQKVTQRGDYGYGFGGRVEIVFDCYSLNADELELIKKKLDAADLKDGLSLVESNTQVALDQLKDDIEKYCLSDDKKKKEDEKKKDNSNENPFYALWNLFTFDFAPKKEEEKKKISELKDIKKDDFVEKKVREEAGESAKKSLYAVYDIYKKAHGMASSPESFD